MEELKMQFFLSIVTRSLYLLLFSNDNHLKLFKMHI